MDILLLTLYLIKYVLVSFFYQHYQKKEHIYLAPPLYISGRTHSCINSEGLLMYSIFDVTVHESSQLSETDMIKTAFTCLSQRKANFKILISI